MFASGGVKAAGGILSVPAAILASCLRRPDGRGETRSGGTREFRKAVVDRTVLREMDVVRADLVGETVDVEERRGNADGGQLVEILVDIGDPAGFVGMDADRGRGRAVGCEIAVEVDVVWQLAGMGHAGQGVQGGSVQEPAGGAVEVGDRQIHVFGDAGHGGLAMWTRWVDTAGRVSARVPGRSN